MPFSAHAGRGKTGGQRRLDIQDSRSLQLIGVLPRYHGQLSEESFLLPLHVQSSLLSRIVAPFDVVKDIGMASALVR
jgi:hypothetical protein